MKLNYFTGGLILAVAVLGFTATTACSEDDIKACETSLQILKTHKDETKILTHECETIRRIVECLQRTSRNCSSSMKQTMISTIAGYKQAEEICQHGALDKQIIIRNKRGVDVRGDWRGILCAVNKIVTNLSGNADKLKQKLKEKKNKCASKARKYKTVKKIELKVKGKYKVSCAPVGVTTCAASLLAMAKDARLEYTCILWWKLDAAYWCLDSVVDVCDGKSGGVLMAVETAWTALGTAFNLSKCNGREPVTEAKKDFGSCTFEKLYDCKGKMVKSPYVNKAHCGAMASAQQCFSDAQRDCKSKLMMSEIQEYKGIIDEYAITCVNGGIVNGPSVIMSLLTCAVLTVVKNVF